MPAVMGIWLRTFSAGWSMSGTTSSTTGICTPAWWSASCGNGGLFDRLRWADAVVCLVTPAYVVSPWCSAEVGFAVSRGSLLLPVMGESGPAHPLLKGIQHANYAADPAAARMELGAALTQLDLSLIHI